MHVARLDSEDFTPGKVGNHEALWELWGQVVTADVQPVDRLYLTE